MGTTDDRRMPDAYRLRSFGTVDSTNSEALRQMAAGAAGPGDVFVAETQTAGRGRGGRAWVSEPGNLHATVVVPPARGRAAGQLALVAGVALREALAAVAPGAGLALKWPNDVLCRGRKVAGVLVEAGEGGHAVGVGANLAAAPPDSAVRAPAASLRGEGAAEVSPPQVLERLYPALAAWHRRWAECGFAPVREAWMAAAAHGPGAGYRAATPGGAVSGRFDGLDADGALRLVDAAGVRRSVVAGDVAADG